MYYKKNTTSKLDFVFDTTTKIKAFLKKILYFERTQRNL